MSKKMKTSTSSIVGQDLIAAVKEAIHRTQAAFDEPYKDNQITENVRIRRFSESVRDEDLVWHRDERDRVITVLEGHSWQFQRDNELPQEMRPGQVIEVRAGEWHRVIKGISDLRVIILESENVISEQTPRGELEVEPSESTLSLVQQAEAVESRVLQRLYELTYKDLRKGVDTVTRRRAIDGIGNKLGKPLVTNFQKHTSPDSFHFKTTSGTFAGQTHDQIVRLLLWPYTATLPSFNNLERARIAVQGDCRVYCSCKAFQYWGGAYITTQLGAKADKDENRAPDIRNPGLKGTVCKHLERVLASLPFWSTQFSKLYPTKARTFAALLGDPEAEALWKAYSEGASTSQQYAEALTSLLKDAGKL